jgi:polyribonucleotide nucleotidyltransferase
VKVDKDKIRDVIGPGGKIIRAIQEETGALINIEDDGTIQVAGHNREEADTAVERIKGLTSEPELGAVYEGTVKTVVDFGAFVEYLPGRDGLVHVSELDTRRVARVQDVVKVGDTMRVKLIGFDRGGKVRLSRKALLTDEQE